jgi:Ca2+-binding EF-hand superfamily protein
MRQLQQAAFKSADTDGDGQLSLSEFQSIGQNVQGSDPQSGPPPMRGGRGPGGHFSGDTLSSLLSTQSVDDLTSSVMKAGDADGDGKMSASELSSALAANAPDAAKGTGASDKMASDIMSALDTDGDGSLSSSEISSAITTAAADESSAHAMRGAHGHHHGPPPADGAEGASGSGGSGGVFESLDTNKDGTVSAEELAAANSSGTNATNGAADLIKAADQDGDGSLSGDEFSAMLDKGKTAGTDASSALASVMSGSTAAADLMQKLLAQLDSAMKTSTSASNSTVSAGTNVTA